MPAIHEEQDMLNQIRDRTILVRACLLCRRRGGCDVETDSDSCGSCPISNAIENIEAEV